MHIIREYTPADQEAIENCIIELQDFEHTLEPDRIEGASIVRPYFESLIDACQHQAGRIFVAEVEGKKAGFVSVPMERSEDIISSIKDYAYISDIVLLPSYRNRGLGKALLQRAEEFARQQGAAILKIQVLARNQRAVDVYLHAGFRPYELALLKELT
jgi:GNAT superfamily N-acetyltransferase